MIYAPYMGASIHFIKIGFLCKNNLLFYNKHKKIFVFHHYTEYIFKSE